MRGEETKENEGKNRMSVLNAVKCKLLARVVWVVSNNKEYVKKSSLKKHYFCHRNQKLKYCQHIKKCFKVLYLNIELLFNKIIAMKKFFFRQLIYCVSVLFPIFSISQIQVNSALDQVAVSPSSSALTASNTVTIRSAIQYANLHPGTTITFASSLNGTPLTLTIPGANENNCATGDLDIKAAVTITGNGPTNTIIQAGTNATNGIDKVFSVNPLFNAAFATNISGITIRYGRNPSPWSGDGFGGGLDWDASGTGTLVINNCIITDNICLDGEGGGLTLTNGSTGGTGSATITNTTISNNRAERTTQSSSIGGGIFVGTKTAVFFSDCTISGNTVSGTPPNGGGGGLYIFGPVSQGGQSSFTNCTISGNSTAGDGGGIFSSQPLTITGCTFSNNQSGRNGGALWVNHTNATTTVTKTKFLSNTASTSGGAVYHGTTTTSNLLNISFSRFSGNTAPTNSGLSVDAGSATAENNWWGCNEGPGNANCNRAGVTGGGTLDFTPWIVLTHTAASNSICANSNTLLTASFLTNSSGSNLAPSNLDAFTGATVTFNNLTPAGATVSSVITVSNGVATAQYNPNNNSGSGGANAVFDNASVNRAITVTSVPTITAHPSNQNVTTSQAAMFTASGTGAGSTLRWQESTGSSFNDINNGGVYSGATTGTLTITNPPVGMNGYQYKLKISGTCSPNAFSNAATLTVTNPNTPPVVTTSGGTTAFVEGNNIPSTPVMVDGALTVTDDGATLASGTVSITTNFQSSQDVLAFTNVPASMGNISGSYNVASGVLSLTSSGGIATLAQWENALRSITYTNTSNTPSTASRTIGFEVNDGTFTSNVSAKPLSVIAVNDVPVLVSSSITTVYFHPNSIIIDNGVTIGDADNANQASATISITGGFAAGDVLAFTNTATITGTYNTATGVLTLTGASATVAEWQAALRSVTFSSGAALTAPRIIGFVVNDGSDNSNTAMKMIGAPATGLALDGTNDYVVTPNLNAQMPGTDVTIEVWFKANTAGVIITELGQSVPNSNWHDSQIEILSNGEVKVRVWSLASVSLGTAAFGTWHHAAVRYNSVTQTLDGVLDGVASSLIVSGNRSRPTDQYYAFGAADNTNLGSGAAFNGVIDEVRIWNRALCTGEIVNNMYCELDGSQTGLVAYYKFNQGAQDTDNTGITSVTDASGNNFHATLENSALTSTASNWTAGTVSSTTCAPVVGIDSVTADKSSVCAVDSAIVTAHISITGVSVSWFTGAGGTGTNVGSGTSIRVGPGTYYARATKCSFTLESSITVVGLAATSSDVYITHCNKYTWHGTTYTASGNYIFDTTNATGCDSTITLHLTLTSLTSTFSKNDAGCFGSATGSLTVTPASGVSPYTYRIGTISSYVNSGTFTGLKSGTYRVSVIDGVGCSGTSGPIVVGESSAIAATASAIPVACFNTYTGAITITPADNSTTYDYSLGTKGVYQQSNTFSNLRAGTYRVTIRSAAGCKSTLSNIVVNPASPVSIVVNSVSNPSNGGGNNGSITVSGAGGAGGYLFKFGTAGMYQTSGRFNNLKAGTYRIFIKDANDCAGASYAVTLTYSPARSTGIVKQRQVSSDMGNAENISISPNPATTAFKVSVKGTQNEVVHLRVMDVNGKVVYTAQGRSNQSFTFGETFMIGMYMIEVRQGDEVKILKAIKMR